jgi:hypothetical protein
MKKLIYFVLLLLLFSSCSDVYWLEIRKTGIEKYRYYRPGWPQDPACSAYHSPHPVKRSTWKKQFYYRKSKEHVNN